MNNAFGILESVLPYDDIAVSLIDDDRTGQKWVRLDWVAAKYENLHLKSGHSAKLEQGNLN